jgi:hypothetical protein
MTAPGRTPPFVPDDFEVPRELVTGEFRLEPLGPQHNEADYEAWTSSIEHIRATPGFAGRTWPYPGMPPEQNLADCRRHADDFANRAGFTYTVLAGDGRVAGCVYVYPAGDTAAGHAAAGVADVRSWVRANRAELDVPLYEAVRAWLRDAWPFTEVRYAPRPAGGGGDREAGT